MENWANNRETLHRQRKSGGFTLVASLMLMLLLSGLSIGLLMMVNTESRVGSNDLQNNLAFHAAEGGMEQMTSDLANAFQTVQAPTPAFISGLSSYKPADDPYNNVKFTEYTLSPALKPDGTLNAQFKQISTGANQGLYAQIIPVTLSAAAQTYANDQVRMTRTVEVALIPVFQFGVFSDSDVGFFNSPDLDFKGRIHTNGNLFLGVSNGASIAFHDKITAWGEVIRQQLPNGLDSTANSNTGNVNILTASGGCNLGNPFGNNPGPQCRSMALTEGSVVGGPTSGANPGWSSVSQSSYNGWLVNGDWGGPNGTGAKQLKLPFVGAGAFPVDIIRRPVLLESPASPVYQSRLYSQAQIRVMISDTPSENHPDGTAVDLQDVRLIESGTSSPAFPGALTTIYPSAGSTGLPPTAITGAAAGSYYFGEGTVDTTYEAAGNLPVVPSWYHPPNNTIPYPAGNNFPAAASFPTGKQEWPLIDGYLRVEYENAAGAWVPVTNEWLQLGFARGLAQPDTATGVANSVHPNSILIFQQTADRNNDGDTLDIGELSNPVNNNSQYFWYPINFYDAREGEVRDAKNGTTCSVNGIMNAVELDVNNLKRWLAGNIGASGLQVNNTQNNGYILYFSDRRGMRVDPATGKMSGDFGFEDVINAASAAGTPDGLFEPISPGQTTSPENINGDTTKLAPKNYGAYDVGDGFGINTHVAPFDPYHSGFRIPDCKFIGQKNRVTGARHVLKLLNGSLGNLPTAGGTGGFTVGSENPVYIKGDYNSSAADPTWANAAALEPAHAAAAVLADAVTLLSTSWTDRESLVNASAGPQLGVRPAITTYYRVAIAGGKNKTFPNPAFSGPGNFGFGTDGGVHNFLRFLEDWAGPGGVQQTLYYKGSLVSLYYSEYATGTFKCCTYAVYTPPKRKYVFDPLFAQPQNLPPGTPMFRDVDNLSYRQDFTPY